MDRRIASASRNTPRLTTESICGQALQKKFMSNSSQDNVPPLLIAIVGVGNIGSVFAYQLARAGHDVTVIARPGSKRLQQLQRDNAIVHKSGERAKVRILEQLDEQTAYDLVVVTLLAHQIEAVLPALQRSNAQCIEFMSNTFYPERLKDAVGALRCAFGMPFVQSLLDSEGRLNPTISQNQKTLHSDERLVKLFTDAGIPSTLESDMPLWLRCHVPVCVALESISVAGQRRKGGASWGESMVIARGMHAGFATIEGLGSSIYPGLHASINSLPSLIAACILWLLSRNNSFRELLASGEHECCALIDDMVAVGSSGMPAQRAAVKAILAMKPKEGGRLLVG